MLKKILTLSFFALILLTPLLFTKYTSELFEYNKMMFVYGLTAIITGTWVLRMISENRLIFKRTPLDIPLALFLLSQVVSTIFSIDVHTSIWGYYSRSNGGLLSIISYLLLYWAFVSNFDKDSILKFIKAAVFSGLLVSLYAIPEHFGLSPSCIILTGDYSANCWVQDVQARVFGTIGQPNWLAAYLAMLIFPAIYLLLTSRTTKSLITYYISLIAMYLAFTFTYSRGATLGLIAGFAVLGLGLIFQYVQNKKELMSIKLAASVALIFIVINLCFGSAISEFRLLKDPAVPIRPDISVNQAPSGTQLENGGTESGQIRLIVWKGAIEIFKAYPLFGSGVETFAYSYYQFRPTEHNNVSEWDFLYNKAHNEYLNYLATTGLFGILTYLSIILIFLLWTLKNLLFSKYNGTGANNSLLMTALAAGYISYLIQNFFLFSVVIVSYLFYLLPAFSFVFMENNKPLSEKNFASLHIQKLLNLVNKNSISKIIIQALVVLVALVTLVSLYNIWEADTNYKLGSDYNDLNNPGRAYKYLIEAVRLNPKEPLFLSELGNAAAASSIALAPDDATTSAELKDDAKFFTDLALSISPVNTTINRTAIRTYFSLSLVDPALEDKTIEIVNNSIKLSPTDPKLLQNKGIIMAQFGRMKEATESLNLAIDMKPNYRDARLTLAGYYITNKQMDLAQREIDAVLKLIPGDEDALKLQEQVKK